MNISIAYTTLPTIEEARKIGQFLVQQKIAGCVNILPSVTSMYVWDGQMEESQEVAMLIKLPETKIVDLKEAIAQHHPYDCPCLMIWGIPEGHHPFLTWLAKSTFS